MTELEKKLRTNKLIISHSDIIKILDALEVMRKRLWAACTCMSPGGCTWCNPVSEAERILNDN